jgi:hypothetical protein
MAETRAQLYATVREVVSTMWCRSGKMTVPDPTICGHCAALAALSALEAGEQVKESGASDSLDHVSHSGNMATVIPTAPTIGKVSVGSCPQCGESKLAIVGPTGHLCCPICRQVLSFMTDDAHAAKC